MRPTLMRAAILAGVALLAGVLAAPAAPSEVPLGDRLETGRLAAVHDRLERRRSLQRNLQAQADAMAAEIEALRVQHDEASAELQAEREQARILEQRLDRLVPRLLARKAEAADRRAEKAAVLADLARKTRSPRLDPRIRARMLALAPLLLERLRSMERDVGSPDANADRMVARHAGIERRLPGLMRAHERLERERTEKSRLRQIASDGLRELAAEMRLLGAEQARLAQLLPRADAALVVRAGPPPQRRGPHEITAKGGAPLARASADRVSADPSGEVARVAASRNGAAAPVPSEPPGADTAFDEAELVVDAGWPTSPPGQAHPDAPRRAIPPVWRSTSDAAVSGATALDVLFSPDGGPFASKVGRARGTRPAPLLPVPDGAQDRAVVAHRGPELSIAAAPGQAVAAPVDGRVAFAGRFKSYGLLLILEHEGEYHTLLWGFARLAVRHGEQVEVGQIVGIMGARGDDPPVLHVERRRNGRPVDIAASSNGIQG